MELKIFRDTLPQAGTSCTVKAELPLETEILISDYLPPVFKLVKCFAKPVVLQKQLQPGRLTLEGYLRCTVFYQGEDGAGLCQTEQKLPFTKQLEVPEFSFTSWMAMVEGQTEYLNCRAVNPHRIEVRGAYGLVVTIHTQDKQELITALADGGIEQKLQTLNGVRSTAVLEKLVTVEGELVFAKPPTAILDITGSAAVREVKLLAGKAVVKGEVRAMRLARGRRRQPAKSGGIPAVQSGGGSGRRGRGLQMHVRAGAGWLCPCGGRTGSQRPTDSQRDDAFARMAALPAAIRSGCLFYAV